MSFAVVVRDVLRTDRIGEERALELGDQITDALIETIKDNAVRREVYEIVRWKVDEVSMVDIHAILDALCEVAAEVEEEVLNDA